MRKDDLKLLVKEIYDDLQEQIDLEEHATKEQVINYLKNAARTISKIGEEEINQMVHENNVFFDAYKDIAHNSISSYKSTNEKFEKLTKINQKTLKEKSAKQIDIESFTSKFNEIQTQMTTEITKANKIISQLSKEIKTLESTSNLDPLTKIFNRRALDTYLSNVCSNKRTHYQIHLLMIDIDDFKLINDKYGHIAGDKILILLSNIIRKTLRDGDKIFRYGGEEFVIVLNRIDNKECFNIANRLLALVRGNKMIYKGNTLRITISIGATRFNPGDTPELLIDRADKALYKAKNNGKNQIQMDII